MINMILSSEPLFSAGDFILILIGMCIVSFLIAYVTDSVAKKEVSKSMEAPIALAKEMGLELDEGYEKKGEILVYGKNYAFLMKYSTKSCEYYAYIYDKKEGEYRFTVSSTDYEWVLVSAKEFVEKLEDLNELAKKNTIHVSVN